MRLHGIQVGSEVFVAGLFTLHKGTKKYQPIVRTGIMSTLMDQLVDPNSGLEYDAYLIELQSIGGLSGSPVFVLSQRAYVATEDQNYIRLLGVIRGHFDSPAPSQRTHYVSVDFSNEDWDKIHIGIAIVTPVQDLTEILRSRELQKQRKLVRKTGK